MKKGDASISEIINSKKPFEQYNHAFLPVADLGGGGGRGGRTPPPLSEFETFSPGAFYLSPRPPPIPPTPKSVFTRVICLFKVTVIIPVSLSSIKGD